MRQLEALAREVFIALRADYAAIALHQAQLLIAARAANDSKSVFLACPTGKRLIGGGARVTGGSPRVAVLTSYPDNDNIWRASAAETTATASNWTLTVYSICATTS